MSVLDAAALDTDPAGMAFLAAVLRSGPQARRCPRPAGFAPVASRPAKGTASRRRDVAPAAESV